MSSQATAGIETPVNSYTTSNQQNSTVTALADGGWLVTWASSGQDGSGDGIYQRRYDAAGNTTGPDVQVNAYTNNHQIQPSVTALADGGWLVSWTSHGQDGSTYGIFQRRYDVNGITDGADVQVNAYTGDVQMFPAVTALADGGWLATWSSFDGSNYGIFQRRYDADGNTDGADVQVNTYATNDQAFSAVTALADGGWVVSWSSTGQDGDVGGIFQQHFNADGSKAGTETQVNTYTTGNQLYPASAALSEGGWVMTWTADGADGSDFGILQQRYDANGTAIGGQTRVNTSTAGGQEDSAVSVLEDGGWVVTWTSGDCIYQQRYAEDGSALGGETQVNAVAGLVKSSSVAALADGGWLVSYSLAQDGSGYGVYQRHYAADVRGGALADTLAGTSWDEMLIGFSGNDTLDGKGGDDILIGGRGNDTYIVNSKLDDVQEFSGQGNDTVMSSVNFSIEADAVENLILTGAANLKGTGNGFDNVLTGNDGKNVLKAGAGDDVIAGAKGIDKLYGGTGADSFVFAAGDTGNTKGRADTIYDFSKTEHDIIDLAAIDASTKSSGNNSFDFIGKSAFSHTAGELRYEKAAGNTWIYGDIDGDGKADLVIHVVGAGKVMEGLLEL